HVPERTVGLAVWPGADRASGRVKPGRLLTAGARPGLTRPLARRRPVPVAVVPFHVRYELTRRQRLGPFLYPWLPCLAPCLGFAVGIVVLAFEVSPWFLPALALPLFISRNFFRGAA